VRDTEGQNRRIVIVVLDAVSEERLDFVCERNSDIVTRWSVSIGLNSSSRLRAEKEQNSPDDQLRE
jgi:hypothetical protein